MLGESGILGFELWNKTQGIPNPANDRTRNASTTDKESWIQYLESGIRDCFFIYSSHKNHLMSSFAVSILKWFPYKKEEKFCRPL